MRTFELYRTRRTSLTVGVRLQWSEWPYVAEIKVWTT